MSDEVGLAFSDPFSDPEANAELQKVVEQRNRRFLELVERCGIEPINHERSVDAHIIVIIIDVDDRHLEFDLVEVMFGVFDYIDRQLASFPANMDVSTFLKRKNRKSTDTNDG